MQAQWLQATNGAVYAAAFILLVTEMTHAIEPQPEVEVNAP